MKSLQMLGLFSLQLLMVVWAETVEWYKKDFPNPQTDLDKCGRGNKPSFVCDPNMVLTTAEDDQLDQIISDIWSQTSCPCSAFICNKFKVGRQGHRMHVALMRKMSATDPRSNTRPPTTTPHHKTDKQLEKERQDAIDNKLVLANVFADTLLKSWKNGSCRNDVVILYSVEDNVVYTMAGDDSRKKLQLPFISEIQMDARRHLSPGKDIFQGIRKILMEYMRVIKGDYKSRLDYGSGPETGQQIGQASVSTVSMTSIIMSIFVFVGTIFI